MRSVLVVLAALAAFSVFDVHASLWARRSGKASTSQSALRPVVTHEGKTIEPENARKIAAAFLRGSRKYSLPADIELQPTDIARIAPADDSNGGRPVTGTGGFAVAHESRHGVATRYLTYVHGNGKAHDAGSSPVEIQEKVRSRVRFGSLLTTENLTQAGLTVGLGLLQIPNFFDHAAGQSATNALTGATLALLIGNTTKLFFDASRSHRDGVVQSNSQSVQFIKDRQDPTTRMPAYPSLAEVYVFYKQKLSELSPGAVPLPLADFSERIAAYGF